METKAYPDIKRSEFLKRLRPHFSLRDMEEIETAYIFAKYGHRGQKRDSGIRYFEHPRAVAWMLATELKLYDWQALVMALLHDISEGSWLLSGRRVEKNFGKRVAFGIELLTKSPKVRYFNRMKKYGSWRVLLVKLCDRLNNMRSLSGCKKEKIRRQIAETKKEFLPLCDFLAKKLPKKDRWRAEYLKLELKTLCTKSEKLL